MFIGLSGSEVSLLPRRHWGESDQWTINQNSICLQNSEQVLLGFLLAGDQLVYPILTLT